MDTTKVIKRILWASALIILVLGIFFFAKPFGFQIGGVNLSLSAAHVGAITSGILSLLSFGYHAMRKEPLPSIISIVHVILTVGLLIVVLYYRSMIPDDMVEAAIPNLESTGSEVDGWMDAHHNNSRYQQYYFIWFGMQALFLSIVGVKGYLKSKKG